MNSWIYLALCSAFVFPSDASNCGGENCVLKEWVVMDCSPCCKINSSPMSAVLKRWICCPSGNDLSQCINHCNLTNDQVEKKGLCTVNCPNNCTGEFQLTATNNHTLIQTSSTTIHAAVITNRLTATKRTPTALPSTTTVATTPTVVLTARRTGTIDIRSKSPPTRVTTQPTSKATASRMTRTVTASTTQPNPTSTVSTPKPTFSTQIKLIASTAKLSTHSSTLPTTNQTTNATLLLTNNLSYIELSSTWTPNGELSVPMQEVFADDKAKQNASYGIMASLFFVGAVVGVLATLSVSWFLKKRKERMSVKQQENSTEPYDE